MSRPKGYTATIRPKGTADPSKPSEAGWPHGTTKYSITLKNPAGKTMTFPFYTGPAVTERPTFEDAMSAVISDGLAYENNPTMEDFAGEFGYDLYSEDDNGELVPNKELEASFEACKSMAERGRALLGDDYDEMAEHVADR